MLPLAKRLLCKSLEVMQEALTASILRTSRSLLLQIVPDTREAYLNNM